MISRSLSRRQSRRRGGVLICSRDVSGHTARIAVTLTEPATNVSHSFLIMKGGIAAVTISGYMREGWNGPTIRASIPLRISARLS